MFNSVGLLEKDGYVLLAEAQHFVLQETISWRRMQHFGCQIRGKTGIMNLFSNPQNKRGFCMNENVYDGLWMNLLKSKAISLNEESIALLGNIFKPKA